MNKYAGPCLYRGKSKNSGKWVYGFYVYLEAYDKHAIFHENSLNVAQSDIDPNTLSAWTGLEDKDGVKIFCGDIVRCKYSNGQWTGVAEYNPKYCNFYYRVINMDYGFVESNQLGLEFGAKIMKDYSEYDFNVIGNIWDNPEILRAGR